MIFKKYLVVVPGIILAFVLYSLSQGFNNIIGIELLGYDKSPISTAMIAILLGMVLGNIFQMRETLLKVGIEFYSIIYSQTWNNLSWYSVKTF